LRRQFSPCVDRCWRVLVLLCVLLITSAAGVHAQRSELGSRQVVDFNPGWRFLPSDVDGAESSDFKDASWQSLSVPHDWSIAGPVAPTNATGQGGGYFPYGVGWYRKDFKLDETANKRHVFVVFDGVMANSDVWINGVHLGKRPYGYVSFYYDLTGHLQFGAGSHNVLAVRCDTSKQPASRWYEGAGIYRAVRLVLLNDVHAEPWSTVVTTPRVSAETSVVHVETTVANESAHATETAVKFQLTDPEGKNVSDATAVVTKEVPAYGTMMFAADVVVAKPERWDVSNPKLYAADVQIAVAKKIVDDDHASFGIREFHFDPDTGFWLNGRNFKIKGAAMHIDGGAVGIAVPIAVYERRLLALRALGVNAIRTAHNPPSPEFLDLCDRLGFLVMEEMFDCWTVGKNPYDYHLYFKDWAERDTRDTVRRDRNHPSIILWSAGNEIHDTPHPEIAIPILKMLVDTFHENDPTRPVTEALFRPNASHDYDDGLADLLDVVGQNYRENELLAAHAAKPTRKIIGTENGPDRAIWLAMRDHPAFSGQFLWTGVDYLGEAGEAGGWPVIANGSGLIDKTAIARARGYERESWWSPQPNVHIARRIGATAKLAVDPGYAAAPARFRQTLYPDWSPKEATPGGELVEVYSNTDEVELLLNGTSLGRQRLHPDASPLTWKVPFEAGSLTAIGYTAGKPVARDELRTAGAARRLRVTPNRTSLTTAPGDVVCLDVSVVDDAGVLVPDAAIPLHVSVAGGLIRAVDNGDNANHPPFDTDHVTTYQGRALLIVGASDAGKVNVTVSAEGLTAGVTSVQATRGATVLSRSF
jgi:beta-galactosidase